MNYYKLQPGSNPKVVVLDPPKGILSDPPWNSSLKDTSFKVTRRPKMKIGDLVEWAPIGIPSVWEVVNVDQWSDPADVGVVDFKTAFGAVTKKMAGEMADEVDRQILDEIGVKATLRPVPHGKVRLKWVSGWTGYQSRPYLVCVKIEDVRELTPLEVLAISAT